MKVEGFQSWVQINQFNAIGIFEVLIRILKFLKLFKFIQRKILDFNPDILITIDSPSFSYRIVKRLQILRNKTKFIHYVAPTVWAWKSYRARFFLNCMIKCLLYLILNQNILENLVFKQILLVIKFFLIKKL